MLFLVLLVIKYEIKAILARITVFPAPWIAALSYNFCFLFAVICSKMADFFQKVWITGI